MDFDKTFGQVRSLCQGTPSHEALRELGEILESMWAWDRERCEESILPYVLEMLAPWPQELGCVLKTLAPGSYILESARASEDDMVEDIPIFGFLERAFEDGACLKSDFTRDHLIAYRSHLGTPTNGAGGKTEVPRGLVASERYDYPMKLTERRDLEPEFFSDHYIHRINQRVKVRRLLIRYLMTYEQDRDGWETLRTKRILEGTWKEMASFGEVEPQHGLMPCELSFIEQKAGFTFPSVVWDFYRLFGRLLQHNYGITAVVDPYDYSRSLDQYLTHTRRYVVFLGEDDVRWKWGYEYSGAQDPAMILFRESEPQDPNARLIDSNPGIQGFNLAYEFKQRFSEFVTTWREPDHMEWTHHDFYHHLWGGIGVKTSSDHSH